jgi:hypothetical protein
MFKMILVECTTREAASFHEATKQTFGGSVYEAVSSRSFEAVAQISLGVSLSGNEIEVGYC